MSATAHHVGIAVRKLDEAVERYRALGLQVEDSETVADQGVRLAFLRAGPIRIELLEPTSKDSAIGRFLEQRGEGLHHVAFLTEDIESEIARLSGEGFELIDKTPRTGSHGRRVAFVHPRSAHGVVLELVEEPRSGSLA